MLAAALGAPLHLATLTRLLVDLNRSAHNPRVFSEHTRALPRARRMELLEAHHAPHREAVDQTVARQCGTGVPVIHLAVHTFTPVLDGKVRGADVALLYDPARPSERDFCGRWVDALARRLPDLAVRRNQPYRGASDGLTTWLRSRHPQGRYLGVEIEVNQRLLNGDGRFPSRVGAGLMESLSDLNGTSAG
jgi:predicted N-formylglutamate amidohydrolase